MSGPTLTFLGAVGTVTGSRFLVEAGGRRLLVDAIRKNQAGEKPPMVLDAQGAREITGPPAVDAIGPSDRLEEYWKDFDANRRRKSAWA